MSNQAQATDHLKYTLKRWQAAIENMVEGPTPPTKQYLQTDYSGDLMDAKKAARKYGRRKRIAFLISREERNKEIRLRVRWCNDYEVCLVARLPSMS